jgi:hypothetical protein
MTMITTAGMYPLKLKFAPAATAAATSSNGSQDSSGTSSSSQTSTADSSNSSSSNSSSSITASGDKVLASVKRCAQLQMNSYENWRYSIADTYCHFVDVHTLIAVPR